MSDIMVPLETATNYALILLAERGYMSLYESLVALINAVRRADERAAVERLQWDPPARVCHCGRPTMRGMCETCFAETDARR